MVHRNSCQQENLILWTSEQMYTFERLILSMILSFQRFDSSFPGLGYITITFIMSTMASQITGVSIVYSVVCPKKTSKLHVTGLCEGNPPVTGGFPSQSSSNAENVSIWWHHHDSGTIWTIPCEMISLIYLLVVIVIFNIKFSIIPLFSNTLLFKFGFTNNTLKRACCMYHRAIFEEGIEVIKQLIYLWNTNAEYWMTCLSSYNRRYCVV